MNFSKIALFLASIATVAFAQYKVINNPYKSVDWETYGKHKAAFHIHTTYSDGGSTVKDMLITHYDRDFSIATVTDHGRFNEDWVKAPEKGAPDEGELADWSSSSKKKENLDDSTKNQINRGDYESKKRIIIGGMIGLKCGSELLAYPLMYTNGNTNIDVGHSFTAGACFTYSGKDSITKLLNLSDAANGINYIHHPGRYTNGGGHAIDTATGTAISNNRAYIDKYVKILKDTKALGMEIMNKLDNESKSDRILYDNILKELAPEKRNVWAFSSDDSHSPEEIGYSFNVMLLPKLTQEATMESMKKGTFYAVARVDRREGINSKVNGKDTPNRGEGTTLALLEQPVPSISKIEVDEEAGIITITGKDYTTIEWIADGVKILSESRSETGNTLNLNNSAYEGKIGRYVRAQLKSTTGIAYTQPFYVHNPGVKVTPWYAIPTGLEALEGSKLSSVVLPTGWTWIGEQVIEEGTRTYLAKFTPSDLSIYNIVDSIDVNVMGKPIGFNMYEISKTGDNYYYFGRKDANRLDSAFNISFASKWPIAPTSIGFGTTPTPTTTMPSPRYAWTYFTKQFTIDNKNFNISELRSVSGRHQIDDAMIMYINGTEVYRFNTSSSSTKIGATVNWNSYSENSVSVGTSKLIDFTINSDYDDRAITISNSTFRDAASLTNFKQAFKPGANVITCAVGQKSSGSSDLFFDLQMNITVNEKNPQPFTNINAVSLKPATYTYTGLPQKPVLMLGSVELVEDRDYTAKYTNNINASGVDGAGVEITGMGNYIGNAGLSFTINKANQLDININPVTGKKFGDAAFTLSAAGGNTNSAITYERVSGPGTVTSAGVVTINGAGNIVVRATRAGNDNFNPVTADITIIIAKASLTLKADDKTVSVGEAAPTYTYTVLGLVGSDTTKAAIMAIITTPPTLSVANFSSLEANKTFAITISGGATTSSNYSIATRTNGTLTIKDKATVKINGLSAKNGTYNGTPQTGYAGTPTFTGGTGTPTTVPTAVYTGRGSTIYSSTSTAPANAGDYTVKLTLDNDPGYKGDTSFNFTISKASLTLKADNKTISVGDPEPIYTYTVSGLIGIDTTTKGSIITTPPTLSVASFSSSTAKTFNITVSGGATTSQNYAIATRTNGTLTVANKTTVAISGLTAQSGPYNGSPRAGYTGTPTFKNGTASVTPTVPTLTPNYIGRSGTTYSSTSTAPTNAGSYRVTLSLDNDSIYKGKADSINFTINKASLTLVADNKTISMGDPVPIYTYSVLGLVGTDTKESIITIQPTLSVANFSSLAEKTFDITIQGGTITNPNYTIATRTNGTLTVNGLTLYPSSSSIEPESSSSSEDQTPTRSPKMPSSNHIMQIKNGINLMATSRAVVEIYGLDGNLIQRQNFKSGVYSISLKHLPKGIYITRASFGSETKILRVVVR